MELRRTYGVQGGKEGIYELGPSGNLGQRGTWTTGNQRHMLHSNCTQWLSLSACRQPLPPGQDPLGKKPAPGDDKLLSNS